MALMWVVTILLFLVIISVFWKLTSGPLRKEYGEKMWKNWGSRLYYWQAAIYVSAGLTILIIYLLKKANVLSF